MESRSRSRSRRGGRGYDEMGEIKKGPWKAEEDEVLRNHVNNYGPRDWSSIRSKGLLLRTGKSCRLRWVNKLRPNLKNGVKFLADEERIVIELQGQFGNKWARIATYLPGRTDNDVKNFWSSRQKRLARILHNPPPPPKKEPPSLHVVPTLEAPKFSSSPEEESSSKTQSCTSSYYDNPEPLKMVPFSELTNPPALLNFEPDLLQLEFTPIEKEEASNELEHPQLSFPHIPSLQTDLPLALESQELFTRLNDPNFFSVFGHGNVSDIVQLPYVAPGLEAERGCGNGVLGGCENPVTPDSFIDDFPMDMFDHIEPLPSPSEW